MMAQPMRKLRLDEVRQELADKKLALESLAQWYAALQDLIDAYERARWPLPPPAKMALQVINDEQFEKGTGVAEPQMPVGTVKE